MKRKTKKKIRWALLLAAALVVVWTILGNVTVKTTALDIHDPNLPQGFDGYRIAQISDLHNAEFGADNSALLSILREQQPDIIVFTGDFVDSRHTDIDISVSFAEQAAKIAPCYYVTGNHESRLDQQYIQLEQQLWACGVIVLHNQSEILTANGDIVQLVGVDDPAFVESASGMFGLSAGIISTEIQNAGSEAQYRILLSHRPELFDTYVENHINLAFCGHAHGGQFRLPLIGGLVAPNQGLFPEYDGGIYQDGDTTMVVSRGVGNSIIPVRFNNRPEVVIAVLHSDL